MTSSNPLLVLVLFAPLIPLTLQASPVLTIPAGGTVVVVSETAVKQKELVTDITCSDTDGDVPRVHVRSMYPTSPCGSCFPVWPCTTGYCLMYAPDHDSLSFTAASSYLVTIECTDDVNNDVGLIDVRLLANTPPVFDVPKKSPVQLVVRKTDGKRAGDVIYDADASDDDNDAIFYTLTTQPDNGLFEIGYTSGEIRARKDLRYLCQDSVVFYISARDSHNHNVGPVIVDVDFKDSNVRPVIENTEREVLVAEDEAVDTKGLLELTLTDQTLYDTAIYSMRADPERGLEYYYLSEKGGKAKIRTRKELNYEYAPLRSVTLYIDVTDGFCDAETYSVTMTITDVDEPPVIVPDDIERTVYEGFIELDPGWKVDDPDEDEQIEWVMTSDAGGDFYVGQHSGIVFSSGEFDVDPDTVQKTRKLQVKVTDKTGQTDKATLKLTVLDKNDNAPYFIKRVYEVGATNCTKVGALIERVNARDDDSEFQGNNRLVYSGTGGNISVLSTGDVTLKTKCVPGHTETIQGYVTDQGLHPGPLSGVPTTIQFTCRVCPVPVTDANTAVTSTTAAATSSLESTADFSLPGIDDTNDLDATDPSSLGWMVGAGILGLLLTAALIYAMVKFCPGACAGWRNELTSFMKRPVESRTPQTRPTERHPMTEKQRPTDRQRPNTRAPSRATPVSTTVFVLDPEPDIPTPTAPKPLPPPPPPPPPDSDPLLFGFWKETYPDRDQRHMPQRDVIPASVEQDREVEEREREEEETEKEERRRERERVKEEYRLEMEKYHEEVKAINNPQPPSSPPSPSPPPPSPPKKKKVCHIL